MLIMPCEEGDSKEWSKWARRLLIYFSFAHSHELAVFSQPMVLGMTAFSHLLLSFFLFLCFLLSQKSEAGGLPATGIPGVIRKKAMKWEAWRMYEVHSGEEGVR
jgi:hypothetical protein